MLSLHIQNNFTWQLLKKVYLINFMPWHAVIKNVYKKMFKATQKFVLELGVQRTSSFYPETD